MKDTASAPLQLRGSTAFRDLGGLPAADGRRVAPGRLFRADELSGLDDGDRAVLDALGLRLVCDLRGHDERRRTRCMDWLRPEPRRVHLDLSAGYAAAAVAIERLRSGPDPRAAAELMRGVYAHLPRAGAGSLAGLFDALVAGEFPALVHCTAGKDRTGFVAAMILTALGAPRETVYEDYLRGSGRDPLLADQPSARLLETIVGRGLQPDEAVLVHGVHREYLDAVFATIAAGWGDCDTFLEHAAGLTPARRIALREVLLT